MNYNEELELIAKVDDSLFPDYLFNPIFNDFEDNYYEKSIVKDSLSLEARGLRRKYSDFFKYMDAIQVYNAYMDMLVEKYGGKRVIKNAIKEDMMEDFVPAKPKLKNSRKNREYMKSVLQPSRKEKIDQPTDEWIHVLANTLFPDKTGENVDENELTKKPDKKLEKQIREMTEKMAGVHRRKSMYRGTGVSGGQSDFIVDYINQVAKGGKFGTETTFSDSESRSILDIVKEENMANDVPIEILEDNINHGGRKIVNGRMVDYDDYRRIETMKELYANGIDIFGKFTKNMSKTSVKMIRSSLGSSAPMTKKEKKNLKKRTKQEQKRIAKRQDSDRELSRILTRNKIDVRSYNDNLSLRLKDIMPDRD